MNRLITYGVLRENGIKGRSDGKTREKTYWMSLWRGENTVN
jgi:hypothetical protein